MGRKQTVSLAGVGATRQAVSAGSEPANRRSTAEWTMGIALRQLAPTLIARATSLGHTVASGDRASSKANVVLRAFAVIICGVHVARTGRTSLDPA